MSTTDFAIQFLSTVASCDQVVTQRPLEDPSVEEVLSYVLQEEIRVMAKLGAYSGVCSPYHLCWLPDTNR